MPFMRVPPVVFWKICKVDYNIYGCGFVIPLFYAEKIWYFGLFFAKFIETTGKPLRKGIYPSLSGGRKEIARPEPASGL